MNHKLHFLFLLGTTIFGSTQLTFSMDKQKFEQNTKNTEKKKVFRKRISTTSNQNKTQSQISEILSNFDKKFTHLQKGLEAIQSPSTIEYIKVTSFLAGSTIVGFAIYNKLFGPQKQLTTMQNDLLEIKALLTKTAPIALQADTIIK